MSELVPQRKSLRPASIVKGIRELLTKAPAERVRIDEQQAIAMVVAWIESHGIDYPTEGLVADRFEVGWDVYAPVDIDDSDPWAFLDMPVGRAIFMVGDSGRIKQTSSSVPPKVSHDQMIEEERAARDQGSESDAAFDLSGIRRIEAPRNSEAISPDDGDNDE
ncbi:hypothetical protein [Nocardia vinacea]|uniref:hypothetical protein n=1 Tax=Nocardia vinacea TaxID=96468 RepID=UPI0012F666DF|nr:hypothetical protein [Nocardia vinacea]